VIPFLFLLAALVLSQSDLGESRSARAGEDPRSGELLQPIRGLRLKNATMNVIQDDIGAIHIMGEIVNASGRKVLFPAIEARLFRPNGRFFRSVPAYTSCVWHMKPNGVAPFDIQFFETARIGRVTITVKGVVSNRKTVDGVRFNNVRFKHRPVVWYDPLGGFVDVSGILRNLSRNDYYFPEVCAAAVNPRGRFLAVGQVPTATLQLPRGQTNTFNGTIGSYPIQARVASVRVYLAACTEDDLVENLCG
jgi:hypothetical protein